MGESTGTQAKPSTKVKSGPKAGAMTIKALEKIVAEQGEVIEKMVAELIGPITEQLAAFGGVGTLVSIEEATGKLTARVLALEEVFKTPVLVNEEQGGGTAARVENMERCLSKMAHYTGSNRVLDEFGIDRWEVTKESMQRKKG